MNRVTYLDHSGFIVTDDNVIMVFDYYRDPANALHKVLEQNPEKPVVFFVSHHHPTHFNKSIFELAQNHRRTYVLSNDVYPQNVPDSLQVAGMSKGDVIEDLPGIESVKAYGSTHEGVSFLVTTKEGKKIFHGGKLNEWHWLDESTIREVEKANEEYKVIINRIAEEVPAVDISFFVVDVRQGSEFARGARTFLNAVKVKDFFPMHFSGDYQIACDFSQYKVEGTDYHCLHTPGESINLG